MPPRTKPIEKILDIETYSRDRKILFRFSGTREPRKDIAEGVEVPIAIVYRLFHLGRAYDFQAVKFFQPQGSSLIDYVRLQLLVLELETIAKIVNDPVVQHYLGVLLPFIKANRTDTKSGLLMSEQSAA
jgi:hypothetical protein